MNITRLLKHLIPATLILALVLGACEKQPFEGTRVPEPLRSDEGAMQVVLESNTQWTGVTVTLANRAFVSFPRWGQDPEMSLGYIFQGDLVPYPNEEWNSWDGSNDDLGIRWVAVQSVVSDRDYNIWVLDTGNPRFEGVIPGAAKLVGFDPSTGAEVARYDFDESIVKPDSYLNDVRIDNEGDRIYITDSGNGALIVIDMESGETWRLLDDHPSTHSTGLDVVIDGELWANGERDVHADGIALHQGEWLYYKALTAPTLYRLPLDVLREDPPSEAEVASAVEAVVDIGPTDGLATDSLGRVYFTDLDDSAIGWYSPREDLLGVLRADERLAWPDSIICQGDSMYITTSRIHEGEAPSAPYALYRLLITSPCP